MVHPFCNFGYGGSGGGAYIPGMPSAVGQINPHQAHEAKMTTKTSATLTCTGCQRTVAPKRVVNGAYSPCCKRAVR
jgi:hypothetical protein